MTIRHKFMLGMAAWVSLVTILHGAWNVDWSVVMNSLVPLDQRKLNVAYIPVT
ncbi:MAG TPA: hypothetical protein VM534_03920 [Thermoanaerobaculia bacterium]|nr:hypothetical protein [Thermoanaerobaculia bacterium]